MNVAANLGYIHTELGLIPESWEYGPMEQFWNILDCKHVTAEFFGSGYPLVSIREVQGRFVDLSSPKFTSAHYYSLLIDGGRKPLPGDLILSRNATVGEVAQVAEWHPPFAMGQDVCLLRRKNPAYSTGYLQSLFQSSIIKNQINDAMVGSTFKRMNVEQIRGLIIPFPPAVEQAKIADCLQEMDALVSGLDQLVAKKRDIQQAAMQQLLTGQRRLPGFSGEWEVKRLGDIARIQRGASPRPIDSPIWFDENSSVGWVRISDVTKSGTFLTDTTQRLSSQGIKQSRPVCCGNLIMSICATVGRPVITQIDVCIHDGFVVFDSPQADILFLYYSLKFIEDDWSRHGQTGSQMNLNTGLINNTKIHLPPFTEQTAIATILSDMDTELATLEARRDKARQLKQAMMQELLTGRIRLV